MLRPLARTLQALSRWPWSPEQRTATASPQARTARARTGSSPGQAPRPPGPGGTTPRPAAGAQPRTAATRRTAPPAARPGPGPPGPGAPPPKQARRRRRRQGPVAGAQAKAGEHMHCVQSAAALCSGVAADRAAGACALLQRRAGRLQVLKTCGSRCCLTFQARATALLAAPRIRDASQMKEMMQDCRACTLSLKG